MAIAAPALKTDSTGNPLLTQYSEEGFVDCVFRITELVESETNYRLQLRASFEGEIVGMTVLVVKNIQGGFDPDMKLRSAHVYRQGVSFLRSGPESDRLASVLAKLYGNGSTKRRMVENEHFTAIALHQGALDMSQQAVKLKLFGRDSEPFDEDAYYESFFNLDLKAGLASWNEKDMDYRKPLVNALTH